MEEGATPDAQVQPGSGKEMSMLALALGPVILGAIIGNAYGKDKMQMGAAIGLAVGLFMPAVVQKVYNRIGI